MLHVACNVRDRTAQAVLTDRVCDSVVLVDRTAAFVMKSSDGQRLQEEIIARNAKNKKFGFLMPNSPYHAYYKFRITYGDAPLPGASSEPLRGVKVRSAAAAAAAATATATACFRLF